MPKTKFLNKLVKELLRWTINNWKHELINKEKEKEKEKNAQLEVEHNIKAKYPSKSKD